MIDITIPMPPSWNDPSKLRTALHAEIRSRLTGKTLDPDSIYCVWIHVRDKWHKRSGKPVKKDVLNYAKVAEDAVSRGLGLDDSYNFRLVCDKRESDNPCVRVIVRAIGPVGQPPSLPPEGV